MLMFDAHNHVHMGPSPPGLALVRGNDGASTTNIAALGGMAIMSTHPRDYDRVLQLTISLPVLAEESNTNVQIVPCLGVHPWFLHELTQEDWDVAPLDAAPKWIQYLETLLIAHPNAMVGEIGLDGFHFNPCTEELTSPMEQQIVAFRLQLELAARLERTVSIHAVQCFGPLFATLRQIKETQIKQAPNVLPPKMYFHAFGGKVGTIEQILALCGREAGKVYFGFAPVVNFRSPKTATVIRTVGIERLVLETDHEDAALVLTSMKQGIECIASVLDMSELEVIERTTRNSFDLYNLNSY
jgi:Tat protein secretion system quality control protein TatD with DNase activity